MTGHTKSFLSSLLIVGALAGGAGVAVAGPARAPSAITAASRQVQTTHAPTSAKQWDQTDKSFAHIYVTSYHVTSYQGYVGITQYYGLSQKTLHEEMDWQDQQQVAPSSEELKNWLEGHGCKLDNLDGPAVIVDAANAQFRSYFRNGQPDRQHPPELVNYGDGFKYEVHSRDGLLDRKDGAALVKRDANGKIVEELFFEKGNFIREVRLASRSAAPGAPARQKPAPPPAP